MKTCVYFAEIAEAPPVRDAARRETRGEAREAAEAPRPAGAERLLRGCGFTPEGGWRPLPPPEGEAGLILDDRFLPSARGLAAAERALAERAGLLLLDFERGPGPETEALTALIRLLAGRGTVLPPAWAALPHAAVLVGPWSGCGSFGRWLEARRREYGSVVLDALPLRFHAAPAPAAPVRPAAEGCGAAAPALPGTGFPCPGAGCLHRRLPDGSILFWDTRRSLEARCLATGVPFLIFREDWARLPP